MDPFGEGRPAGDLVVGQVAVSASSVSATVNVPERAAKLTR